MVIGQAKLIDPMSSFLFLRKMSLGTGNFVKVL